MPLVTADHRSFLKQAHVIERAARRSPVIVTWKNLSWLVVGKVRLASPRLHGSTLPAPLEAWPPGHAPEPRVAGDWPGIWLSSQNGSPSTGAVMPLTSFSHQTFLCHPAAVARAARYGPVLVTQGGKPDLTVLTASDARQLTAHSDDPWLQLLARHLDSPAA